ncbi:hypothetical protein F4677DRAFT_434073 [Hypoxylon crocopeplum]|nr:hypothetical protein F4677DRAFT_434073 [Hypoxylon crocopeplum]
MNTSIALPPDEDRGPTINAIAWVGAFISTVFVGLRLYSRGFVTRSIGWDDGVIVLAAILNIITSVFTSVAITSGLGRHIWYLNEEEIVRALYYSALQRPPGILAYCLPKLSIVTLLCTLIGNAKSRAWFWILHSIIVVLFITSILSFVLFFVRCSPATALWDPSSPADCFDPFILDVVTYISGSWSAFVDVVLASFPIYLLWNLQMKRQRKVTVMILMALGFFASAAAIAKTTQLKLNHPEDPTWESFYLFIATYIETNLVIIAASTPALPKMMKALFHKGSSKTGHQYESGSGHPLSHNLRGYREFDGQDSSTRMVSLQGDTTKG